MPRPSLPSSPHADEAKSFSRTENIPKTLKKNTKKQRPTVVKVKAQRLDGSKFQTVLSGWAGRIFLHEYDHLQGVLFHDRMEEKPRREALPRLARLEELFVEKQEQGEASGGPPECAADGRRAV